MKMTKKTYNMLTIAAVGIAVVGLSVAFAALSSTLSITGSANLKQASWAIDLQTPMYLDLSTTASWVDNPIGGAVEGTPTVSGTTVSFQAALDNPGDYAQFTVPVKNNGTINAVLTTITKSVTGIDSDLITLTVTESGSDITNGSLTLNAGETKEVLVRLAYNFDIDASDLPTEDRSIAVQISMVFEQN